MFNQLGVIGCGLIGGSFALALKRAGRVKRVIGYSKSPSTTERGKKMGVIDTAAESALQAVAGSDIVLVAVPVSASEATFKAIRHLVEPGVLLMDVGSTKRDVVDAAECRHVGHGVLSPITPRLSWSRSMDWNSAVKLPSPKPSSPRRSMNSKNTGPTVGSAKICSSRRG